MGGALAQRLSTKHTLNLYDRNSDKTQKLHQAGFGNVCADLQKAVTESEIVILAVKPAGLEEVLEALKPSLPINAMIVSILTGTTLAQLGEYLSGHRIIRMMPNLAVINGKGLLGICLEKPLNGNDEKLIAELCEPLGKTYFLPENKMNAFTSLVGSGPAFFFVMMEAMVEAGISMGFSARDAQGLVNQMVEGSISLLEGSKHPGDMKWQITSPAGTTIAGLNALEAGSVRWGIISTFLAAFERANEMTKKA